MKITVFTDVMPCSLPDTANILEEGRSDEEEKKRRMNKKCSGFVFCGHNKGYIKVAGDMGHQLSFYSPEQHKAKVRHFLETSETEEHTVLPQ
jgi:hypothetical protein